MSSKTIPWTGLDFLLMWTLSTAGGLYIGEFVGTGAMLLFSFSISPPTELIVTSPIAESKIPSITTVLILLFGGAIAGATLGTLQWLVLRRQIRKTWQWIIGSLLGTAIIWSVIAVTKTDLPFTRGIIFGAIIGIFQWPVLRRWRRISLLWIPLNVMAWSAGYIIRDALRSVTSLDTILWLSLPGILAGIFTALFLMWLFRLPLTS